jgi:hypothetical protein
MGQLRRPYPACASWTGGSLYNVHNVSEVDSDEEMGVIQTGIVIVPVLHVRTGSVVVLYFRNSILPFSLFNVLFSLSSGLIGRNDVVVYTFVELLHDMISTQGSDKKTT